MASTTTAAKKAPRKKPSKQVHLRLVHIDFWSSVKLAFLVGLCLAVVTIVVTLLVWAVLDRFHIFDQVNELFTSISPGASLASFFGFSKVMGFAIVVAILNLVVCTALGAIGSVLYNLSVKISGGLSVGLRNE